MKKPRKRIASTRVSSPEPIWDGELSLRKLERMAAYSGKIRIGGKELGTSKMEDAAIFAQRRKRDPSWFSGTSEVDPGGSTSSASSISGAITVERSSSGFIFIFLARAC